ncbi:MAG: glycoside hydrolase family 88 protein, partial [Acidobacteriota bacterium]
MAIEKNLIIHAAQKTQMYPFRIWGFGEAIAMDALLGASRLLEIPDFSNFVYRNIGIWMAEKPELTPADHVAPGISLLSLYQHRGEDRLLTRARQLADLLMSLPESRAGVRYHRPDENDWSWVDCLYTDGPFLARLGNISSDSSLLRAAVDYVRSYLDALLDPSDRLFYHGRDEKSRKCSPYYWGRGNGWALMGLVDVLIELPDSADGYGEIKESLGGILHRIETLQDASGHWHTILDYPESALEPSVAA